MHRNDAIIPGNDEIPLFDINIFELFYNFIVRNELFVIYINMFLKFFVLMFIILLFFCFSMLSINRIVQNN